MPKGFQGFQKGHGSFLTKEQYKIIADKNRPKMLGHPQYNTGKTHFRKGHGMNKGSENPQWKGGRTQSKNGYVFIKINGHPMANSGGYIMEHRLVMSEYLGRILSRKEIVHHKNKIPSDNRIENLEVMNQRDHSILHCSNKINLICKFCNSSYQKCKSHSIGSKYCSRLCQNESMKHPRTNLDSN